MIAAGLVGGEVALARLRAMPHVAQAGVARAIAKLGTDLQNNVRQDKLSGQLLAARSGSLRSSIELQTIERGMATTATVFTNLDYAAAHEFGFAGTVNVRASLREIKEVFGHPIAETTVGVRAHSRRMDLPERSFLRSALDEMSPDINAGVDAALREAVTG